MDDVLLNTRKELQHGNVGVELRVECQRQMRVAIPHQMRLIGDVHTCFCKGRVVVTVEGGEMFRIAFGRPVCTEETVLEIDGHFRHDGIAVLVLCCGYLYCRQQVLFRIAPEYPDG